MSGGIRHHTLPLNLDGRLFFHTVRFDFVVFRQPGRNCIVLVSVGFRSEEGPKFSRTETTVEQVGQFGISSLPRDARNQHPFYCINMLIGNPGRLSCSCGTRSCPAALEFLYVFIMPIQTRQLSVLTSNGHVS